MAVSGNDWLEVPTIRPMFQGYLREYPYKTMAQSIVLIYLHVGIPKFPLNVADVYLSDTNIQKTFVYNFDP